MIDTRLVLDIYAWTTVPSLGFVLMGRSNREIVAALDIGDETVKTHVGNLVGKLGVETGRRPSCRHSSGGW